MFIAAVITGVAGLPLHEENGGGCETLGNF